MHVDSVRWAVSLSGEANLALKINGERAILMTSRHVCFHCVGALDADTYRVAQKYPTGQIAVSLQEKTIKIMC